MCKYNFYVPGEPIPQKRHRYTSRNGYIRNYDPCSKEKENFQKKLLPSSFKHFVHDFFLNLLEVELIFGSMPPKYLSSNMLLWNQYNGSHVDCDNLAKFVLDACNGILWKDDSQIVTLKVTKIYSENSFTKISLITKNKLNFEGNMKILTKISPMELREFKDDCYEISKLFVEDVESILDGCQSPLNSSANTLVDFVKKHYPTIHKLHKEILKWPQEKNNE